MKIRLYPIAVPLLLGLAACVTEYSKSEAPAALQVDGAESRVEIAFAGGSDRLPAGEARRLDGLVLAGNIRPADRVAIAAAGPPALAERRATAISGELLRYGIVASTEILDDGTGQSGDRLGRPLHGDLAGLPELEPVAGRRVHQRAVELLRLRQCDKPRPDGGKPGRPRQRPPARASRRPARRHRRRALHDRPGQAAARRPRPRPLPRRPAVEAAAPPRGAGAGAGAAAGAQ